MSHLTKGIPSKNTGRFLKNLEFRSRGLYIQGHSIKKLLIMNHKSETTFTYFQHEGKIKTFKIK
jgi:hypothetical protein